MRLLVLFLLVGASAFAQEQIPAVDPAKRAAIEDLLSLMIRERLDFARIKPEYIKLYDETFTTEELTGIVAFYKSPPGQAYLAELPALTSKSVDLAGKIMADSMQQIQAVSAVWSESMKKKYGESGDK